MTVLSLQQMPNGFELETPSFSYWFKAGIAFTLGAGIVTVTFWVLWVMTSLGLAAAFVRTLMH